MRKAYVLVFLQLVLLGSIGMGPVFDRRSGFPIFGGVLFIIGLGVLFTSFGFLGKSLTPNPIPKETGQLVTTGIYAFCRHPIYVALFLMAFGTSIYFFSWMSIVGSILLVLVLNQKAKFEEELLVQKYGKEYEAYQKCVKRFWPK